MLRDSVDLDHDPVDLVGQLLAQLFCFHDELQNSINVIHRSRVRVHKQASLAQRFKRRALLSQQRLAGREQKVGKILQPPLRNYIWFQRAYRAGGSVARIGRRGHSHSFAFRIHLLEGLLRQHNFAAHLKLLW